MIYDKVSSMEEKNRSKSFISIIKITIASLLVIVVLLNFTTEFFRPRYRRIEATLENLQKMRSSIVNYKKDNLRLPQFLDQIPNWEPGFYKEYISTKNGESSIGNILDGSGGWYYNPENGNIKVNIIETVNKYIPNCKGFCAKQKPSDW